MAGAALPYLKKTARTFPWMLPKHLRPDFRKSKLSIPKRWTIVCGDRVAVEARLEALRAGGAQKQAAIEHVYEALIAHLVIFIEDQHLTPAEQVDFALQFGGLDVPHPVYQTLKGCPEIVELENDGDRPPDTNDWHTDLTFRPNPPFMSILYAKQVPQTGGDTLWSNLYAVFDALPDDLKALLRGQSAIHDIGTFRNDFLTDTMDVKAVNQGLFDTGSAVHRIVQTHPVTHREFLYVNPSFTQHIVGFKKSESDRLLRYLYDHANQPEFQVRYRWRPNSLALWDNRVTQHYAIADYLPEYRKMHRVTVINDLRSP